MGRGISEDATAGLFDPDDVEDVPMPEPEQEKAWPREVPAQAPRAPRPFKQLGDMWAETNPSRIVAGTLDDGVVFMIGQQSHAKSFLSLSLSVSVASGQPWLDREVTQGPVIYLSGEGNSHFRKRQAAAMREAGLDPSQPIPLHVRDFAFPIDNPSEVKAFLVDVRAAGVSPRLIVVDTFQRYFSGDENSQRDAARFISGCDTIRRELGCAVLVIHHTGKSGDAYRGSSVLMASADQGIFVEKKSGDVVTLKSGGAEGKQKDGRPVDMTVQLTEVEALDLAGNVIKGDLGLPETTCVIREAEAGIGDHRGADSECRLLAGFEVKGAIVGGKAASYLNAGDAVGMVKTTAAKVKERLIDQRLISKEAKGYRMTAAGMERLAAWRLRSAEVAS
jgi:hypothetical protein